jgi:hypothetical protein
MMVRVGATMIDHHEAPDLLRELNDALVLEGSDPVDWVVCGGTALALRGLITRATQDLDVIGGWGANVLEVVRLNQFPDSVNRAIDRVADVHHELRASGHRWVNLGPQGLLRLGLPPGCTTRLSVLRIGTHLTLRLPARIDLVAMKLFAAADSLGARQSVHQADVRAMRPTDPELTFAIDWICRIPDPNHTLRTELRNFLKDLGHDDHAYYIT